MDCAFSSLRAYRGKSEIARLFVTFHTIIEVRNLNGKREELEELCQCYVVVNASAALPARILRVLSVDPSRRRLPTQCIFLFFTQFTSRIKQSSVLRLASPRSGQAKQCCSVHSSCQLGAIRTSSSVQRYELDTIPAANGLSGANPLTCLSPVC